MASAKAKKFGPGDVVVLKSGGPKMTVRVVDGDGEMIVIWFSEKVQEFRDARMLPELVTLARSR